MAKLDYFHTGIKNGQKIQEHVESRKGSRDQIKTISLVNMSTTGVSS